MYGYRNSTDDMISSLKESLEKLLQWFFDNQMQGNTDKCHLIVSVDEPIETRVGESLIKNSTCEKLLGVKINSTHNFNTHAKGLCMKANNKLRALTRAHHICLSKKRKFLRISFFHPQFNYYPLIWMLHS